MMTERKIKGKKDRKTVYEYIAITFLKPIDTTEKFRRDIDSKNYFVV